jgi:hypothetical protein
MRWKGARMDAFQAMDWPRRGVEVPDFFDPFYTNPGVPISFQNTAFVPENVVPTEVKHSHLLLARSTMDSTGAPTVTLQPTVGRATKREKLGADSLEVEYFDVSSMGARQTTIYWDSQQLLLPFLKATGANGSVVRS